MADGDQVAALEDLVLLRIPVAEARERCGRGFDRDELLVLTAGHVVDVLDRLGTGALTPADVEAWADAVHLRDDLGREPGLEDAINEVLIELSTPELFGAADTIAPRLLARLAAG